MVKISLSQLKSNLENIVGLKISRVWKGHGSSLFLELGALHEELAWEKDNEPVTTKVGEITLSSAGAWKLFKGSKQVLDAESASPAEIKQEVKNLESLTIKSVSITRKLQIMLSNNCTLEFYKRDYGFFTLVSNEKSFISYEDDAPHASQQFYF